MGVSFTDANTGYMAAGIDGEGPAVLKSTDHGVSWNELPHSGAAMMFLDIAMGSTVNGVVGGIGLIDYIPGTEYTLDGQSFNASQDLELESECQSVEDIVGLKGGFGLAGQYGEANGVAVSRDYGVTYDHYDANLNDSLPTRYGSFPSAKVWYLTAGMWPDTTPRTVRTENTIVHKLTQRVSIEHNKITGAVRHIVSTERRTPSARLGDGYTAGVTKSIDGGKTWTTVYTDFGNFYPNAISCASETQCWMVCESEDDSPNPGSRIIYTGDGGKTWQVQLYNKGGAFSLIAIRMVNGLEGWAGGGELDASFTGQFFHTVDGKNWTLQKLPGEYVNNFGFFGPASDYDGWATSFNWMDQSSLLVYK